VTPWRNELVDGGELIVDGHISRPSRPGLGLTLNRSVLAAHHQGAAGHFTAP
jgi:L-alanine-DL-glutamate epimerase-like enolase superfamily enzyme